MTAFSVPLWSIGVALMLLGPLIVQRLVAHWTKAKETRTDAALSAMSAGAKRSTVDVLGAAADQGARSDASDSRRDPG